MNPIKDTAIWAVSLLPDTAPEWAMGMTAFAGIILALVAIVAPACIATALIVAHRERHHERI